MSSPLAEILNLWHQNRTLVLLGGLGLFFVIQACRWVAVKSKSQNAPATLLPQLYLNSITANEHKADDKKALKRNENGASEQIQSKGKAPKNPKRIVRTRIGRDSMKQNKQDAESAKVQPHVFFASLTASTQKSTEKVAEDLNQWRADSNHQNLLPALVHDLSYIELDDFFISPPKQTESAQSFYIILLPTYNVDSIITNFLEHLKETHHDFRIDIAPLSGLLGYSVFGFGDKEGWPTEEEGFCSQAIEADKWMAKLTGRRRAFALGVGDVKSDVEHRLAEWTEGVKDVLSDILDGHGLGDGVPGSGDAVESDEEDEEPQISKNSKLDDVEDLGRSYRGSNSNAKTPLPIDFTSSRPTSDLDQTSTAEMVPISSPTYAALTKQGYTIVGSHSGVKICRWTKSALRGRGSCYKYTFYGIASHQCMETTPSLSCSNKCVFCWRHGTNPVATRWRWKVDAPEAILAGAKAGHYQKIRMLKGVPGVRAERFAEAMAVRHCALSLVGEPIFYPRINEFLALLHADRISSFLVCNAQHPDQLQALEKVTQLYVSIDASNRESLRRIDRPLHRDFWERFTRCLDILREKRFQQRTVFRLTLVKGFNIEDEVEGYAELVERGLPCFVEIKGVTFCGTSTTKGVGLTMQNVPFYEEVCAFVEALNAALEKRGLQYGIAAEHAHSCCVLLASTRFKINDRWCTRIDYGKFFECLESGKKFSPEDYVDKNGTPEWALWGHGGFDPRDERVYRKGKKKEPIES